jgi:hypothetical protein
VQALRQRDRSLKSHVASYKHRCRASDALRADEPESDDRSFVEGYERLLREERLARGLPESDTGVPSESPGTPVDQEKQEREETHYTPLDDITASDMYPDGTSDVAPESDPPASDISLEDYPSDIGLCDD